MPQATTPLLRTLLLFTALFACSTHASAASYVVKHCAELEGQSVPASVIGLPTRGATILGASVVAAAAPKNRNGEYCRLVGVIKAQLDTTPDIRFEVNLPARWNGRA
jgi:hypothetical protein